MRTRTTNLWLILATVVLAAAAILTAAGTGEIKGVITDENTGKPVVGASVLIVGSTQGAMTDFDGKFMIRIVDSGTYTIKISHLEYETMEIKEIQVSRDLTTEVKAKLRKKQADLGITVKVKSEKDIIDKFEVSNQVVIGKEEIERNPYVRGGRAGEVIYKVSRLKSGQGANKPRPDGRCGTQIPQNTAFPPAHGGSAIVNGEPYDAMFFENHGVNPFVDTEDDNLSTFAIDVDDASFIMARSYIEGGNLPPKDAVRTEEFVNHFKYNYSPPRHSAFSVNLDGAPSRFGQNSYMLRVGIKGREVLPENRKAANLVFVIDVSGSMQREDRLGLVKKALTYLVDELRPSDEVGIVIYGSRGQVVLEPTSVANKQQILSCIQSLRTGGSTNAGEGIRLGYEMARRNLEQGKINRVILCSDGVANVGQTGAAQILKEIKPFVEQGITLSSIGFGMGNYNDILLEKLGNKGNGHYAYVNDITEARRIFVDNLTGNLQVIARDVKIQVEFDPMVVRSYRLLGYENRDVADNKFRDDMEDGGEIGAGHEVTALYEVKVHDERHSRPLGEIFIRFKDPDNGEVTEVSQKIEPSVFAGRFSEATSDLRLAACAAEFAEILRKSYWAKGSSLSDLMVETKTVFQDNDSPEMLELMNLISKARDMEQQLAEN